MVCANVADVHSFISLSQSCWDGAKRLLAGGRVRDGSPGSALFLRQLLLL
jgi:hypothetical protein